MSNPLRSSLRIPLLWVMGYPLAAGSGPVTTNLVLQLDASNKNSLIDTSTWIDLSGHGHNAAAVSAASATTINGLMALQFSGGQSYSIAGQVLTDPNNYTVMAVVTDTGTSGARELFSNWTSVNSFTSVFLGDISSSPTRVRFTDYIGGGSDPVAHQTGRGSLANPANPFILSGISSFSDAAIYQNGTLLYELLADGRGPIPGRILSTTYYIGDQGSLNGEFWVGKIGEILVYNSALSPADFAANINYLTQKWLGKCQVTVNPRFFQAFQNGQQTLWSCNLYDTDDQCSVANLMHLKCPLMDPQACRIGTKGCLLTALAMALETAGLGTINGQPLTPATLNDFLDGPPNLYGPNGGIDIDAAVAAVSAGQLKLNTDFSGDPQSTQALDDIVCRGFPAIVGTNLSTDQDTLEIKPTHFVLVTGDQNNQFQIIDPGHDSNTTLSGQFLVQGYISDPSSHLSRLDVDIGTNGEILVVDQMGRLSGFDSSTKIVLKEIPRSAHFIYSLDENDTGVISSNTFHAEQLFQPSAGSYRVVIGGLRLGQYTLTAHAISSDGSIQPNLSIDGVAAPGATSAFQIAYNPSSGSSLSIIRVASVQSTLADINNSLRLGLIDDIGIANSLSQKIQGAQSADEQAKNGILNAFKNEVNAQSGKHITGIAPQVLLQDADSLIGQNP